MFRVAVLSLIASAASAAVNNFTPTGDIVASSDLGSRLLSQATLVQEPRHLEQNNQDISFIATYSLRYLGCSSLVQVRQNGQNGGGNNNKNGNVGMLMEQHLVKFQLCPDGCSSCTNGGEYIVNMETFVDLYTEYKLKDMEYTCEMIRENCYCDNANDDEVCLDLCYTNAGMTDCINYEGEQEEFKVQQYLQCAALGKNGNNNNNNNNNGQNNYGYYDANGNWGQYYMGPYCSAKDGKSIHLGVFMDGGCTTLADDEVYASKNYGTYLPFSAATGKSLVVANDCVACTEQQRENNNNNNNNNNQNQEARVNELCENSYKWAAKCETALGDIYGYYKDVSACDYIQNILPRFDYAARNTKISKSGGGKGAKAFATIFAFTTALFAGYAYFLYRKIKRGSVNLSMQE